MNLLSLTAYALNGLRHLLQMLPVHSMGIIIISTIDISLLLHTSADVTLPSLKLRFLFLKNAV